MSSFVPPPYLSLIIILISINASLMIFCIYSIVKNTRLSRLRKIGWSFVVLFFCFIGPIVYIISSNQKQVS